MSGTLVEYDYDKNRIYAIAQVKVEGHTKLYYFDAYLDAAGIRSFQAWESSTHGLVW